MKIPKLALIAVQSLLIVAFETASAQTVTVSSFGSQILLADGSPASGFGLVGFFVNPDNVTLTPVADIQANFTNLSWMSARFRPFGDGTPSTGEVFTFTSGSVAPQVLTDNNFFTVTGATAPSPGSASSLNYSDAVTYVWVFNGAVPTTQAAYNLLQTGVFSGVVEILPGFFTPDQSFTFNELATNRVVETPGYGPTNFALVAVPEPSTVALALLGAAGVLIARRRRK